MSEHTHDPRIRSLVRDCPACLEEGREPIRLHTPGRGAPKKIACQHCGKDLKDFFQRLRKMCEDCGRAECKKGNHVWEPAAIGPGVAVFDCLYCDAASDGTLEPLKQMGFQEVKPEGDER